MKLRILCPLLALLALPVCGKTQGMWPYPDVWESAGTRKADAATIQTLVGTLAPGAMHRMSGCIPPPSWGTGTKADEAAAKLVEIGNPAIPALLPLLTDATPGRRQLVVEILGRIGNRSVTPSLLPLLASEADGRVRESLVESVVMLRDARATNALIQTLQDKSPFIQMDAARGLGLLKSTQAIEPLTALLRQHRDAGRVGFGRTPDVAGAVAGALGMIGEPALPALLATLNDPATQAETLAVTVMPAANVGDRQIVPALLTLLTHTDDNVRYNTLNALNRYPDTLTVPLLSRTLHDTSQQVRWGAAILLGARNTAESLAAMDKALHDADNVVQRDSAPGLDYVTSPDAVPMLIRALQTSFPDAQYHAAAALGNLKDKRAISPLLNALASADPELRRKAALGLGGFNDPHTIESLLQAIDDPTPAVRMQVVIALRDKRDARIMPAFQRLINDDDPNVRIAALVGMQMQQKAAQK